MASVQIGCPCPGHPHDSDSVQLRDVLDFRHAAAIKYAVRIFKMDHPDSDAGETLQWLKQFAAQPQRIFLTHGEPMAADALRLRIAETLGWHCELPDYLESAPLQ